MQAYAHTQPWSECGAYTHISTSSLLYPYLSNNVFWLLLLWRAAQRLSCGLFSVSNHNVKLFHFNAEHMHSLSCPIHINRSVVPFHFFLNHSKKYDLIWVFVYFRAVNIVVMTHSRDLFKCWRCQGFSKLRTLCNNFDMLIMVCALRLQFYCRKARYYISYICYPAGFVAQILVACSLQGLQFQILWLHYGY